MTKKKYVSIMLFMTIYALSTGPGVSGVAIIRVSGIETKNVIKSLNGKIHFWKCSVREEF